MTRTLAFNSFAKGEISPYMRGRIDTDMYYSSAETLDNVVVRPTGVPVRRAGTKYSGTVVQNMTYSRRILPFVSTIEQSYILELGNLYMKIYGLDGQPITMDLTDFDTWTDTEDSEDKQYEETDLVTVTDDSVDAVVRYFVCIRSHVTDTTTDESNMPTSPDTDVDGSFIWEKYWYEYTNAADEPTDELWTVNLEMPYDSDEIQEVDFAQKNDIIKITHNLHDIGELRNLGDSKWAFIQGDIAGAPWAEWNEDPKKYINILDKNVYDPDLDNTTEAFIPSRQLQYTLFKEGDEGRFMRMDDFTDESVVDGEAGQQGYFEIVEVLSSDRATVKVISEIQNSKKTTKWSWNAFYEDNYPANVTYHESRLVLANTPEDPQKVWFSKAFLYNDFNTSDSDESGFDMTANAKQGNPIEWISSGDALATGTTGGEFISKSPSDGSMINDNKNIRKQSSWGSSSIKPKEVGSRLYFIQRGGRRLREYFYARDYDNYSAKDMTEYADHITISTIADIDFQLNPDGLLFCVLDNGTMAVLFRDPDSEALAWTTWETVNGLVRSIAVIPNPDGLSDRVFLLVDRDITVGTNQYLEYFDSHVIEDDTDRTDLYHVDCGVTQDSFYSGNQFNPYIEETVGIDLVVETNPNPHINPLTIDNPLIVQSTGPYYTGLPYSSSPPIPYAYISSASSYFNQDDLDYRMFIYFQDPNNLEGYLLNDLMSVRMDSIENGPTVVHCNYIERIGGETVPKDSTGPLPSENVGFLTFDGGTWGRYKTNNTGDIVEPLTETGDFTVYPSAPDLETLDKVKNFYTADDVGRNVILIDEDDGSVIGIGNIVYFYPYDSSKINEITGIPYPARVGVNQSQATFDVGTYHGGTWGTSDDETPDVILPPDPEDPDDAGPWNNLGHLNGLDVDVTKNGVYVDRVTVVDGAISKLLVEGYITCAIGLPITSTIQTNPLNAMTPIGMAKGKIRRINELAIDVYKSLGMEYSVNGTDWFPLDVPEGQDNSLLFTGTIPNITFEGALDYDGKIYLRQAKPYPLNLLGIYPKVEIND